MGEGPGDLQGLTAPAAANLDRKNEEAAAPGSCKLRVATSFAVVGVVCRTARGGVGPGVRLSGTCDGADAGGVDGELLSMIQAEPVGDNFEAAAIGNWLVKKCVFKIRNLFGTSSPCFMNLGAKNIILAACRQTICLKFRKVFFSPSRFFDRRMSSSKDSFTGQAPGIEGNLALLRKQCSFVYAFESSSPIRA